MEVEDLYGDLDDGKHELQEKSEDGSEEPPSETVSAEADHSIDLYDEIYGVSRRDCEATKGPVPKNIQEALR